MRLLIVYIFVYFQYTIVYANVDNDIRQHIRPLLASEKHYAGLMSDILLVTSTVTPYAYSLSQEHKGEDLRNTFYGMSLNIILNQTVKHITKRDRPDMSDSYSFYSGHASNAMYGMSRTCKMMKHKEACPLLISIPLATGVLRMKADKHWFSDVLVGEIVGASFGILF